MRLLNEIHLTINIQEKVINYPLKTEGINDI